MRPLRCWFRHPWDWYQHSIRADDNDRVIMVIAWKQCPGCGASKLVHILR